MVMFIKKERKKKLASTKKIHLALGLASTKERRNNVARFCIRCLGMFHVGISFGSYPYSS